MNAGLLMELAEVRARMATLASQAQREYESLAVHATRMETERDAALSDLAAGQEEST